MARKKNRCPASMSPRARYEFAVAYLNAMLDDAGPEELASALGRIARACGGPKLAEKVELSAGALYRTLCRRGNPELRSATVLLKAMGMRLVLEPVPGAPAAARTVSQRASVSRVPASEALEAPRHGTCVGSTAERDERDSHG